ncbi:MAG TPA: ATP-binding protein [Gaiellaceae bacterium]|nr:ATP-binding protein [Gaiellaceae bacterium]
MTRAGEVETARLLLQAARYLNETLEPRRVYERFRELLAEPIPHDGVVVSSVDAEGVIRCDYAWVDGELLDVSIFPPLRVQEKSGMQSEVIRTGRPLLTNDVAARVQDSGTYYDVDSEGTMRKVPDEGAPKAQAAMMLPVKHEGTVVGVVQLMSDHVRYERDQLELAEGMVAQLGAAVRNARLHTETLRLEAAAAEARATARERERAAQVLEAVGDGIFFVDSGDRIRFWNRGAEAITGRRRDDLLGGTLAQLGAEWAALGTSVPAAAEGETPLAVTLPFEVGGKELWLSFVAVRTHDGCVYAFRDLTAERQFERSRSDFIATVSHELRTPMTAVLGAANTLLRPDLDVTPETRRELLEMIASQAARLSHVTESVLLAGRLDRGEVAVDTDPIDVDAIAHEAVEVLRRNAPAHVVLTERLSGAGTALGDAARLQQVLINVLDNAVKYSPSGGTVTLETARNGRRVSIVVSDEGAGISEADSVRIFEKFYRGDPTHRLVPGGTGLGLYISRELVERMRGRLELAPAHGAGSTFRIELVGA